MEANEAARVAEREKRLALPAPEKGGKERKRRGRSVSSDRSDASREAADNDETTVAAKLASAVLRALDERAGAHGGAHGGGQSGGFAGGVPAALAETRRVAEEAKAAAGAALKSSEDGARRRETEALIEARLEERLRGRGAQKRDGDDERGSHDVHDVHDTARGGDARSRHDTSSCTARRVVPPRKEKKRKEKKSARVRLKTL